MFTTIRLDTVSLAVLFNHFDGVGSDKLNGTDRPLFCCSVSVFLSVLVNIFNRGLSHCFRRHYSERSVGFGLFWCCVVDVIDVYQCSITKPLQTITKPLQNHYKTITSADLRGHYCNFPHGPGGQLQKIHYKTITSPQCLSRRNIPKIVCRLCCVLRDLAVKFFLRVA